MKKLLLLSTLALALFTTGCKLRDPDFSNSGDTKSDSYQPVTKGSYWKFNDKIGGTTATQVETHTMTGGTETFNGKTYYTINLTSAVLNNALNYYYHGNDSYSVRSTSAAAGATAEYVYLKDNYAIGKTWTAPFTDDGSLNGVPAQTIGQIVEKGITKIVSGKTFTDVIHTKLLIQYDLGNGFETIQTLDYYIAKGVGIIEADSEGAGITSTSVLTDYSIK
jgi:hypothetical protein